VIALPPFRLGAPSVRRYAKNRGFTLIELLVAVAIAAVITTPVLLLTTQMYNQYRRLRATTDMVQNATFAFSRMAREVSAAYWHGPLTITETDKPNFIIDNYASPGTPTESDPNDRLSWHATSFNTHENAVATAYDMVEFGLKKEFHTAQTMYYLGLRKQTQSGTNLVPDADVTAGGTIDIGDAIAFNLKAVRFQAMDGSSLPLTKTTSWSYPTTQSVLPKAVRITLVLTDPNGEAADLTISADISTARQ